MMEEQKKLINIALVLSLVTIFYNLVEGLISIYFGLDDETLALLGFGVDSFVEVISGIGILHMIIRMKRIGDDPASRDKFERTALRITGFAFYLLTAGLVFGAIANVIQGSQPETTVVGIIISSISIATMWFLMYYKKKIGKQLNSDAIIADANCTKTCFYLSIILLASSGLYEIFRIPYIDVIGSLAIAWFAFSEGREAFEKSRSQTLSCGCGDEACEK
ncbi:MAG: cation transporter [Bacteroidales bacterium]|nr:cation transporter [Bacteroidales bacterium]MCF8351927.1 cation transporter [Bacteroidales bacterium]MCF8377100.1 cation transporter [Bacteroidales bacterium]